MQFRLEKQNLLKGENLVISGNAYNSLKIVALQGGKNIVFSDNVKLDWNGDFSFSRQIVFSDPKGAWTIILSDASGSETTSITVSSVRESEFFLVSFISPAADSFRRLETVELTVNVLDAGNFVEDAFVYYWDASGKRQQLRQLGLGKYSSNILLPIDANLGGWQLIVTVQKSVGGEKRGGENVKSLKILPASILIDVLEPKVNEYVFGKPLAIRFKASYDANIVLERIKSAEIEFNGKKGDAVFSNGVFFFEIDPSVGKKELVPAEFKIIVTDSFENTAEKTLTLRPVGEFSWFLKNQAFFYIVPAFFLLYLVFLFQRELFSFFLVLKLKRRRSMLLELKKRLQQDYFSENVIAKQDYDQQSQQFDSELLDIDAKLTSLEQKKELL